MVVDTSLLRSRVSETLDPPLDLLILFDENSGDQTAEVMSILETLVK